MRSPNFRVWPLALAGFSALGLAGCGASEAPDCGQLAVKDAWVRVAPEGSDVMGAYLTLVNSGDSTVIVNGISSTQFDRAELHETVVNDDGQASMQPLERVRVDAGDTVAFKPGGRHVMLFEPSQHYAAGDQVELVLACGSQHAELPAAAIVRSERPQPGAVNQSAPAQGAHPDATMSNGAGAEDDAATSQ